MLAGVSEPTRDMHPITVLLVRLALMIPLAWWFAFAAHKLWVWYAVPLGAPDVAIWTIAGLHTLATWGCGIADAASGNRLYLDQRIRHLAKAMKVELPDTPQRDQLLATLAIGLTSPAVMLLAGALYRWLGG